MAVLDKATLGQRLKKLRKENGWTILDAAFHAGISGATVSRVENDRCHTKATLDKMAAAYGKTLTEVISGPSDEIEDRIRRLYDLSSDERGNVIKVMDDMIDIYVSNRRNNEKVYGPNSGDDEES